RSTTCSAPSSSSSTNSHAMRPSNFKKFILLAAALSLAGCAVGPNYKRPVVNAPTGFRGATNAVSTNSFADLPWWSVFKDPVLQDLVQVALTNNYDLRIILTRVDQARALQAQTRSHFLPQVDYRGDATRGQNSFLGSVSPNGGKAMDSLLRGCVAILEIELGGR